MSPNRPEHADDLLSAHLDAELDAATEAWVEAHLESCPTCQVSVAELAEARALVRGLPAVDSTGVVEGVLARHRHLIRLGVGFVAVAATVVAVFGLTAATEQPLVVPALEAMTEAHRNDAHTELGLAVAEDVPDVYVAPPGLLGSASTLSRRAVYDGADLTAVLYGDGDVTVSVYQQPGRLDWASLPDGEESGVDGQRVWLRAGTPVVAVAERGDLVVTVVSEDRGATLTAIAGMPERRRQATWDRVHDACQRFTSVFTLAG